MRLAREYPDQSTLTDLGLSKALILLGVPEDERDAFTEGVHDVNGEEKRVDEMSSRETKKAVRDYNNKKAEETSPADEATGESEPENTNQEHESYDPANAIVASICHLEKDIDSMLKNFEAQIGDTEDYDESISLLREFCNKTLKKLPPVMPTQDQLSQEDI
jgi:hypothetical protein